MKANRGAFLLLSLAAIGAGCAVFSGEENDALGGGTPNPDAGDGGSEGPVVQAKGMITFTIETPSRVFAGDTFELNVTITQQGTTGPIRFELAELAGVEMSTVEVPAGVTTARLNAKASTARRHGPASIELKATSLDGEAIGAAKATLSIRGHAGEIDNSFAEDGVFALAESSEASAVRASDVIEVGGRLGTAAGVLRLSAVGKPDPAFASNGILRASSSTGMVKGTSDLYGGALAVTLDAAGTSTGALFRFGGNGVVQDEGGNGGFTSLPIAEATALSFVPGPNGLLIGGRRIPSEGDLFATYVGPAGSSWGINNTVTVANDCSAADKSLCAASAILGVTANGVPSGVYMCAHRALGAGSTLARANAAGDAVTVDIANKLDRCATIGASNDGVTFVGGNAWGTQLAGVTQLYAFNSSWNPPNVTNAGVAEAPASSGLTMVKRLAATSSSITVAADATLAGKSVIGLWRILPDGKTDMTFGNGKGYTVTPLPQGEVVVRSMALDNDGRPIVVGSAGGKMFVARFWN